MDGELKMQQLSLRSLRKTLLAFRTAAHMNEEDADQGSGMDTKYRIDSAQGMCSFPHLVVYRSGRVCLVCQDDQTIRSLRVKDQGDGVGIV